MTTSISNVNNRSVNSPGVDSSGVSGGPELSAHQARLSSGVGLGERTRAGLAPQTAPTFASRTIIFILCLTIVLSTLAYGTVHSWSLMLFYITAASVAVCWALDAFNSGRLRINRSLLQVPLIGLILVGFVQLLPLRQLEDANLFAVAPVTSLSLNPFATSIVMLQLAALLIYFAAALAFIDSPRRLRLVVRTIIIFGFVLAFYSMIQSVLSPGSIYFGLRTTPASIPFGPYVNRHHFAGYMELTLALPLGLLFAGAIDRDRRLMYGFAVLLMGVALLLTGSRGGIISLFAEITVIVFLSLKNQNAETSERKAEKPRVPVALVRAGLGIGLVVALIFGLLFVGGDDVVERVVNTSRYGGDVTTGRAHFWRVTLDVIRSYPLLGTGLGAFGVAYTRFDTINPLLRLEQAHNDYLQLLADAGIIGGLLGLLFVVVLFREGLRRINTADKFRRGVALGALGGCSGVLMHSFFEFALHAMANALLFLVLAALATIGGQVEEATTSSHSRRPPPQRRRRRTRQHDSATDNNTSRLSGEPAESTGATLPPSPQQV